MKDRRQHPRYPARWRVIIHCHCHRDMQQKAFDGLTSDISLGGMCIHSSHNLCTSREMDLTLLVPPLQVGGKHHQLKIRARANHTVLVGEADVFRTGIQFVGISEPDRECLKHHLETRFGFYPIGGLPQAETTAAP
ncbi:PilZ domain-containing protein [Azovibrio restrictus]|uniref:PilZ domain-containing protein n=1 Tax=Azovibrio restrictus TaxID=146938 RepID=UPI0026F15668|nr:PilZ domain-containing protein [Azovibrio restrictus]MDD3481579.1 PilZ domain-containing protein [Azovibrio restrictus]